MNIIDNKKDRYPKDGYDIISAWQLIEEFAGRKNNKTGKLDIVTGYFTIGALAKLQQELSAEDEFRIVCSELVGEKGEKAAEAIDLLNGDLSVEHTFALSAQAKAAVAFLRRDNVRLKAVLNRFCHAKVYLFKNANRKENDFYLVGSSNLTDAGLGLRPSSNIELNIAHSFNMHDATFDELEDWFADVWSEAEDKIPADREDPSSPAIDAKEWFIRHIENYFVHYTPLQIYYKILFELFGVDVNPVDPAQMALLRTSEIWKTLFPYQQQGVISLVQMIENYGGAILADAVGLGKTFSALAVIKYFSLHGYKTLVLCPKRLERNWSQYINKAGSRFEKDEFDFEVRFHSDLQDDRLEHYDRAKLSWLVRCKKLLIVIDESHNLRNEKSARYQELLENLINGGNGGDNRGNGGRSEKRSVKVLLLSATPINTGLADIKGQFNLIAKGDDAAFSGDPFGVGSLSRLFADSQRKFSEWRKDENRTIGGFVKMLQKSFFNLTDKLIVARTRQLVEKNFGIKGLGFPKKLPPENVYQGVDHFGNLKSAKAIHDALMDLNFTAYQPSRFVPETEQIALERAKKDWKSDVTRDGFLAGMMTLLFMKRLESSWKSCLATVGKVWEVHEQTLEKIEKFKTQRASNKRSPSAKHTLFEQQEAGNEAIGAQIEEVIDDEDDETSEGGSYFLRKGTVSLAQMENLAGFEKGVREDALKLGKIYDALKDFERKFERGEEKDAKLDKLEAILTEKQKMSNKKAVVFTVYADTADFLFGELQKRGFTKIACVTGQWTKTSGQHKTSDFKEVLESFAPYSKLYKEREWGWLYEKAGLNQTRYYNEDKDSWNVSFEEWQKLVERYDAATKRKLDDAIDILVATDCLSEGQNLQDADLQINYDVHWNPVRLIQRFGRIDRIGSPNKEVHCVNFWPAKSLEEYLSLEKRVKDRMVLMTLAGSEMQDLGEDYARMLADNPLLEEREQNLLDQMTRNSLSEIEGDARSLSMSDLSYEVFRQDLRGYIEKKRDEFLKMPRGVFSGFKAEGKKDDALVAVLGWPKREAGSSERYKELYLIMQGTGEKTVRQMSQSELLAFLRDHKDDKRSVPEWIENGDRQKLLELCAVADSWMKSKVPQQAEDTLFALSALKTRGGKTKAKRRGTKESTLTEDKFKKENFDLVVWEYVSGS